MPNSDKVIEEAIAKGMAHVYRTQPTVAEWIPKAIEIAAEHVRDAFVREISEVHGDPEFCPRHECPWCAIVICPRHAHEHFWKDGCPACYADEVRSKANKANETKPIFAIEIDGAQVARVENIRPPAKNIRAKRIKLRESLPFDGSIEGTAVDGTSFRGVCARVWRNEQTLTAEPIFTVEDFIPEG